MIGRIWLCQSWKFICIFVPIKIATVHNAAADAHSVSIHILRSGMRHNIRPPLNWTTVNGSWKCIIHDQRHPMLMCYIGKLFDVKDHQCRIGNCLRKEYLGIWTKRRCNLFSRSIWIYERAVDPLLLNRSAEKIKSPAINCRRTNHMVASLTDIENRIIIGCLSRRSKHCRHSPLQLANLFCYRVIGGILQTGIKISAVFQIKQSSHLVTGIIFKSRALINRQHPRFSPPGMPARLNAFCFYLILAHLVSS